MTTKKLALFISHAWDNLSNASLFGFITELEDNYGLWIDTEKIKPGDIIRDQLVKGIKQADVILLLLSKNCLQRADIIFEIETAIQYKKPLIPCLLDEYGIENLKIIEEKFFDKKAILFIDFHSVVKGFQSGFLLLNQYLLEFEIEKLGNSEDETLLKEQNERLSRLLNRMQFIRERQAKNDAGNQATNQAILMMARQLRSLHESDKNNYTSLQYVLLAEAIENIILLYPDPNDNKNRITEFGKSIDRIDSLGQNMLFQKYKELISRI